MMLNFKTMEKVVGTFVISVFILLLSMVVLIGRGKDWFRTKVTYYTTFGESYNLDNNSSVKLFNADIGTVTKVNLVGDRVEVTLAIYQEFAHRIRTDSIASVEGLSYIGKKYISIKPGSADAPLIAKSGTIPSIENKTITDFLAEFEVEKTAKRVIQAIQNLSEITNVLKDPQGPLFGALDSINITLAEIEQRIGGIMDNVLLTTSKVPGTVDQARTDLEKVQELTDALAENIEILKKILINIEKGSQDVPPVTQSVKVGVEEIRSAVKNVDDVVKSLQKNALIRSNIPPAPKGDAVDAGLR